MIITSLRWEECVAFLSRHRVGRLACSKDDWAYVLPIHYAFVVDRFYSFSLAGQKIEWMRENPHVCIEVDVLREHRCWESVVARGVYQELPDNDQWHDERMRAWGLLQQHNDWWEPGAIRPHQEDQEDRPDTIFFRVTVQDLTGRKALGDHWKAEEP
jgi:nitroimidazol reductase NimA-like FMN-containing flavoprotein (pyridoxamine 5'-phosphate oxidase superfamily)